MTRRTTPSLAALVAGALLLAACLVGGALDPAPPPLVAERAGYQVVEADLHVHTRFSDGFLSPLDVVVHARRQGLGAIALTEHNVTFPARMARGWSRVIGGPEVIVGEEITTRDYHLLAFGLERAVDARLPLARAIDDVHAQGGVVVAAHPARRYWPALEPAIPHLDGVELVHPVAFRQRGSGWAAEDFHAFWERVRAVRPRAVAIGTSDYHAGPILGLGTTLVFARSRSAGDLVEALREGRTVVEAPDGALHGDRALVQAIEREPLPARPPRDVRWEGRGVLDRIGRVVACLGVVALVVFRRERTRPGSTAPPAVA